MRDRFKMVKHILLVIVFWVAVSIAAYSRCDDKDSETTGATGDNEKIHLQLWDCARTSSDHKATCGGSPEVEILLEKGEERNTGYYVNGRDVVAKYYGKDLCVSFYRIDIHRKETSSGSARGCKTVCLVTVRILLHIFQTSPAPTQSAQPVLEPTRV